MTGKGIHPGMLRISQLESGLLNSAVSGSQCITCTYLTKVLRCGLCLYSGSQNLQDLYKASFIAFKK